MKKMITLMCVFTLLTTANSVFAHKIKTRASKGNNMAQRIRYTKSLIRSPKVQSSINQTSVASVRKIALAPMLERVVLQRIAAESESLKNANSRDLLDRLYRQKAHQAIDKRNPNIESAARADLSLRRRQLDRESSRLETQVEQMRKEDITSMPEYISQEITTYYDGLRNAEYKRHIETRQNIVEREASGTDPDASYQYQPELDRHQDALDDINRAEIEARNIMRSELTFRQQWNWDVKAAQFKEGLDEIDGGTQGNSNKKSWRTDPEITQDLKRITNEYNQLQRDKEN